MDRNSLFKNLYRRCSGYIELRAFPSTKIIFISLGTDWLTIKKQVDKFCQECKDQNIYFGIATRNGKGGKTENIISIPCVWVEIDYKDISQEKVQEIIDKFPFKPTIIIKTGGGVHLYFLLEQPVDLKRSTDVRKVNDWIRLELSNLGGCQLDNIGDIPRILRLADTINHKYEHKPLCEVAAINSNIYTLDDFLKKIPKAFEKEQDKKPLRELYSGTTEGHRNTDLTRLVGSWVSNGLTFDECFENALLWNDKNNPPLPEEEINAVIRSILKKHEQNIKVNNIEPWQDPIPFDDYSNLPEFPTGILPSPGREMVEAVARVNQVDKGLPASIYLAALSTCLSKKATVDLGTHIEPVNIYTCPILDPGERKTSTMRLIMSPIYEYQEIMKRKTIGDVEPPIFVVDDITAEALFKVMSENNEQISVISAEGGIFSIMAGRYNASGNGNFDIYLKGHAGDHCSNHRIGRKSQSMDSPSLTMCLTVQRDVIKEIGSNRQFRGRGLLARFLYCNCVHKAGHRKRQKETIPETLIKAYRKHIIKLMAIPLSLHELKLSSDAQTVWDEFYNDIETDMQAGKQMASIKDWGSKLPGAVARIAGLLHIAEYGLQAMNKPISVGIVGASVAIGAYYREHAFATFGLMKEHPEIESAKKILDYLIVHKPDSFKGRDVLRNKNAFKTMKEITPGLEVLVERNYIRVVETESPTGYGRPEATFYEVNPIINTL